MRPDDAPFLAGGARALAVCGRRGGRPFAADDWVAEEVPVALQFNGVSHAVMLATPADLEDFALGFALSEGLLQHPGELYDAEVDESEAGITLHLEVASAAFDRLKRHRRTLAGRTGCGLCGAESLAQVRRPVVPLPPGDAVDVAAIAAALDGLRSHQRLQQTTGATHAAGWCHRDGRVALVREDVGRHNALDKLIGALARRRQPAGEGFVVVTSRASYEMVQKAATAGATLLAAVSAPTTLAVELAESAGLTLLGFARGHDLVAYAHAERLTGRD